MLKSNSNLDAVSNSVFTPFGSNLAPIWLPTGGPTGVTQRPRTLFFRLPSPMLLQVAIRPLSDPFFIVLKTCFELGDENMKTQIQPLFTMFWPHPLSHKASLFCHFWTFFILHFCFRASSERNYQWILTLSNRLCMFLRYVPSETREIAKCVWLQRRGCNERVVSHV